MRSGMSKEVFHHTRQAILTPQQLVSPQSCESQLADVGTSPGHVWEGNYIELPVCVGIHAYGLQDVVYDDFIANFTASNWNPSAWLDLFTEAGAKYFVIVTVRVVLYQLSTKSDCAALQKHHDGYGLFDTKDTTHRSSVYLNPHRDFVKELMDTAKSDYPDLHRGTYYSLPEW
jgi:hypothetical protein